MAGIADIFRDSSGEVYSAFVILTTAANESTLPIHDRMPVVLAPEERDLWIHDDGFTKHALGRTGPGLVFSPARR
jgi:putative SOS response-associated peptidase YedK